VTAKTKIGSCVFMLGVLVIIAGCASETAKKPGKLGLTKVLYFFCAGTDGQIVGLF